MTEKTHQPHPEPPTIPNPESLQIEVRLPTMVNLRPLKTGEELCIYKPRDAPPSHKAKPIDLKRKLTEHINEVEKGNGKGKRARTE